MSAIETYLQYIANKVWARDVRTAIVNAIRQCYDDVHNPTLNTEAIQAAVQAKIDAGQMAALTIGDHTITAVKLALGVIPTPDTTLSQSGVPADAKKTGDEIAALQADLDSLEPGLSDDAKVALLNCFAHVKWSDGHGQNYYDALEAALYEQPIPVNPFESAEYDFGGWGFGGAAGSQVTSTGYYVNKNTLTNRAGSIIAVPCSTGRLIAKSGYKINANPLASNGMESATISGSTQNVYVHVIYTDVSQYQWETEKTLPAGTKYCCVSIKKDDNTDFSQSELTTLYGTAFEYEEVTV